MVVFSLWAMQKIHVQDLACHLSFFYIPIFPFSFFKEFGFILRAMDPGPLQ